MPGPWSLLSQDSQLDPDTASQGDESSSPYALQPEHNFQNLAALGMKAIQSGKITVAQAKKNAQMMGIGGGKKGGPTLLPPEAQQALSMSPQTPQGPLDMSAMNSPDQLYGSVQGAAGIKGASENTSQTQEKKDDRKIVTSSNLTKTPEQARLEMMLAQGITPKTIGYDRRVDPQGNDLGEDRTKPIYDINDTTTDENAPYQQQLKGLNGLRELTKMRADSNAQKSMLDLSPLMALADSVKSNPAMKTDLLSGYHAPQPGTDQVQAGMDEVQKRQADLQKSLYENVKNLKGGSVLDQLAQFDALKNMVGAGQKTPVTDPAQMLQDRNAFRAHQANITAVKKDPVLNAMTTQYMNLNNAISNMANAHNLTPQQFQEAQQAIRANLGIKSGSGVDERSKTMLENAGYNVDNLMQFIQGKPASLNQGDPDVRHIEELAANEKVNVRDFYNKRLQTVSGGNAWVYDDPRYQMYKDSLDPFLGSARGQITPTSQVQKAQKQSGLPSEGQLRKAPAPRPQTGPQAAPARTKPLEQMSPQELDAYEAALKGGK